MNVQAGDCRTYTDAGAAFRKERYMTYNYRVTYEETIESLEDICELFHVDNSDLTMKFVIGLIGMIVLVMMFIYGDPGDGTPWGILVFLLKFLIAWVSLGITAIILNRTVWRKAVNATATGDAEIMYQHRKAKNGKTVIAQIDFCEDRFESVTELKTRAFGYDKVVKLLETERAFGLVVKTAGNSVGSVKSMVGFPKSALLDADIEELKKFLLEKCPGVKNRIKKF